MENTQKQNVLENTIAFYVQQGYRVSSQTENTAQLVKPKKFDLFCAVFLFLILIFPFILYLLYYLAQDDKTIYIFIDDMGMISITDEKGQKRKVENVKQLAVPILRSVSKEEDPGIQNNTKIVLGVLAVIIIIIIIVIMIN